MVVIAGPCSVESHEQLLTTAKAVQKAGAVMLRGGAYKPRTSPYDFQGLGREALEILAEVRRETGMPVVTEVMSTEDLDLICEYADMLQIGARNMQNFALLRAVGESRTPVLLKRSMMGTIEEMLLSAEYIMKGGNSAVILCERGIRTFETETRNTLDIGAVPAVKRLSHLPIIVDPSHAMGDWRYVPSASMAAMAAGADGIIVEIHPDPANAKSDGRQSLTLQHFEDLFGRLRSLSTALEVSIA